MGAMASLIMQGFHEDEITIMIDTDKSYTQPTGKNVKAGLVNLIANSGPGDILVIDVATITPQRDA